MRNCSPAKVVYNYSKFAEGIESMKVLTVVGARPQFIKAAVVSRAIQVQKTQGIEIKEEIIHTGQHFDYNMSTSFFDELNIPKPVTNLNINGGTHGQMTGRMLEEIEKQFILRKPDAVLVYGDTNSTLAGALGASKLHIKVAHVEAGLRSFNRRMPEEINRVTTDHISDILFCPTTLSVKNLQREGITANVHNVGDVMYDSFLHTLNNISSETENDILSKFALVKNAFILVTCHRAENTNDRARLEDIFIGFNKLSKQFNILLPLHPGTFQQLRRFGLTHLIKNLNVLPPISYQEILVLLSNAQLLVTDSGGLQKEAFFAKTTCVTLRQETEWSETLSDGNNRLYGADCGMLENSVSDALQHTFVDSSHIYGTGDSGKIIVDKLLEILS